MDVGVYTGTFGSRPWADLAFERAFQSVPDNVPWVHAHRDTLHEARNAALASIETEWCILLDADDQLEPGYIEAMAEGTADVRAPVVRYVDQGRERLWKPHVAGHTDHECHAGCLEQGNWLICGSMVRTQMVRDVGGWRDFPWSEDWDLWVRCHLAGATFGWCDDAVYRAWARPDSRNRGASREEKLAAHQAIYEANFAEAA